MDEFVSYVGPEEFHDATIGEFARDGDSVTVRLRDASGNQWLVKFDGVDAVNAHEPVGMTLYSLSELRSDSPLRRFAFVNWDEEDSRRLEIVANNVEWEGVADAPL